VVFFWIVFGTHHQPFAKQHFHKTFVQALIVSSYPRHLFLISWKMMLGYVSLVDWWENLSLEMLLLKLLHVLIIHY
jgi:hypothetical protein